MPKKIQISREDVLTRGNEFYLSNLSIDCVIFGFHENSLRVLLLQFKETGRWCLPGGFILKEEHLDEAAVRTLRDRTQLRNIYLHQFHTFGKNDRISGGMHGVHKKSLKDHSWILDRFVTVGYWALVEYSKVVPLPDEFSKDCKWWEIDKIPKLILDHNEILKKALASLRMHLNEYPLGKDLLSEKFTMPELQSLYETILGKQLDRRNFQKKILSLGILERLKERKQGGAHKAPFLYRFDQKKYQQALKQGLKFGI
jgi:8-oxo-dGTP diphosphatase